MKKAVSLCLLMCGLLLFSGCSGGVPDQDTISVDKRGRETSTIVEDFDKDFYDADELEAEIEEELADYNRNFAADHIRIESFEVKDGVATLQLVFDESQYYADYTGMTLFVGTRSEAEEEGYDLPDDFVEPNENAADLDVLDSDGSAHVLILEEAVQVRVPGTILAVCPEDNVTVTGDREASAAEPELSYIIYK